MELKLFIIPGSMKKKTTIHSVVYQETYFTWKRVWDEVYQKEMGLHKKLYSDEFLRQDSIVSLFSGSKCVGMAFLRLTDFTQLPIREDSYFKNWPSQTLNEIETVSGNVALASYFTLDPMFRQKSTGLCMKTLLLSLFLENFNSSSAEIMITAARRKKSNEKLCSRLGSKILATNLPYKIDDKPVDEFVIEKMPLTREDQDAA